MEPSDTGRPDPSKKPFVPVDRREAFEIAAETHKAALAEYASDTQRALESMRAGNASGAEAIKAATLINGGAAVAMLAFIGHLASIQAKSTVIVGFANPLRLFVAGTLLGVIASGVTYFAQSFFTAGLVREFRSKEARRDDKEELATLNDRAAVKWRRIGQGTNLVAVLAITAALACFAFGCYLAYRTFESGFI